ncbi:MFS transporter [Kineococcus sp. SYSU DK001]|uniref:MFS transporter n=1 Tax=Kineococcus sp. SYSU DK001 TaxID=3383122 RepID=UPI003D7E2ACB
MTTPTTLATASHSPATRRRVAVATLVGTTIEWYDFFIYGTAAGLVFSKVFFAPAGPQVGLLLSFATVGVSFLFRPLGAFLAGHFGDRIGRRAVLVLTLVLMGGATALIGLLPTYATAGVLAPVLLLLLRIVQGVAAGGEWGGAVLMAVEHAHPDHRGRAGAFPQLGVPLGMLLASGVTALVSGVVARGDAFVAWGWRIPFLLGVVLVAVGFVVRRAVEESPVFEELRSTARETKVPAARLLKDHWRLVVLAALVFAGNGASGYMLTGGYVTSYTTDPDGPVGLDRTPVLLVVAAAAALWGVFTFLSGALSDRIGRRTTYLLGYAALLVAVFPLMSAAGSGDVGLLFLGLAAFSVGLGLTYGPQAAWYSELFPAPVRFSGVALSYALGSILGGAFAPTIAQALVQEFGSLHAVGAYLCAVALVAVGAVLALGRTRRVALPR